MTDELATQETELAPMSELDLACAEWLVLGYLPGDGNESQQDLARRLKVDRSTVSKALKRGRVLAHARAMVLDNINTAQIPAIMAGVMAQAIESPKFGLEVLKYLRSLGISPLPGNEPPPQPQLAPQQQAPTVQVNVVQANGVDPNMTHEQRVRVLRGVEDDVVDIDD